MVVWIGIDDTDSKEGGCTTYVAAVLVRRLESANLKLIGFPRLIRLNPNCPYKTRGNAAIALKLDTRDLDLVKQLAVDVVEECSRLGEGAETGVALLRGDPPPALREFYWRALRELVPIEDAFNIAREVGAEVVYYGDGRGLVGALAAIGADLSVGRTYELIAHRVRDYWGTVRKVDSVSVYEMDKATRGYTFDNVDYETGDIKVTPHTPCPVLLGIRGVDPEILKRGFEMLRISEPVEYVTIFETNQATDIHYSRCRISELKDGANVVVDGLLVEAPRKEIGGHVFFKISDGSGLLTCAAYEPTKNFREIVMQLMPGDEVTVYGAVKLKPQGLTLNLEKIWVKKLAKKTILRPPICQKCGKRMKSLGSGKGYKCRKCGRRVGKDAAEEIEIPRELKIGFYEVTPAARRHLVKPLGLSL